MNQDEVCDCPVEELASLVDVLRRLDLSEDIDDDCETSPSTDDFSFKRQNRPRNTAVAIHIKLPPSAKARSSQILGRTCRCKLKGRKSLAAG